MTSTYEDRTLLATDVAIKAPCRVATTANITLSGLQTIDGVVLVANDRVLVKNQTSGVDNGIYLASTGAWTRTSDFNGNRDAVDGTMVLVRLGTASALSIYELSCATSPAVIGTTVLVFNLVSVVVGNAGSFTTLTASGNINGATFGTSGVWTPIVGGTATYTVQNGTYVKLGNLVLIRCRFQINVIGTGSKNSISGLPFNSASSDSTALYVAATSLAVNVVSVAAAIPGGGTSIDIYSRTAASSGDSNANNVLGNGTVLFLAGFYTV